MKLEINRVELQKDTAQATMSHQGQVLYWNLSLFEKLERSTNRQKQESSTEVLASFDIFEQINSYWAHLQPTVQDKIFDVYRRIREAFDSVWDTHELTRTLHPLVAELYQYHDLAEVRHWYNFHSNLQLPARLEDTFVGGDTPGSRERTYLKEDYKWLTCLAVAVRAMIPVWGEFIIRTYREKGTALKEYYAFKLLSYSSIIHSEPMERLKVYVEASLPQDKSKESAILGAISSEDFPIWVLSLVVVRRLAVGDLRGLDPNSHLVTFIFKYIGQKVKSHDNSFIGLVKPKQVEGQSQEGENNLSKLEGYKVKQEIPAGDIEIIAYDMRNHAKAIARICPDLPEQLLRESLESVRPLAGAQLQKPQVVLMQWVLKPVMPPRGADSLSKQQVIENIGLTQAMLWHRGHYELAGMISAIAQSNQEEMQLTGSELRTRMPKEMVDRLHELYPFARRSGKANKAQRPPNVAITNIDLMAQMFHKNEWRLTLPGDWVVKLTSNRNIRRYATPHDIRIKLATLAIALASRQF